MTEHTTHTVLRAAPEVVYDYLTRPARWREWHHASLGAEAHADASMPAGAEFREQIRTVGIRKILQWQVLVAEPPLRWEAAATMDDGSTVRLHYWFEAIPEGTCFTRTLGYTLKPWSLRLLNASVGWAKVRIESRQALQRLQRQFER
jgi:uncharacterized protein YndB with AHSA1/START domain